MLSTNKVRFPPAFSARNCCRRSPPRTASRCKRRWMRPAGICPSPRADPAERRERRPKGRGWHSKREIESPRRQPKAAEKGRADRFVIAVARQAPVLVHRAAPSPARYLVAPPAAPAGGFPCSKVTQSISGWTATPGPQAGIVDENSLRLMAADHAEESVQVPCGQRAAPDAVKPRPPSFP